jgi:bifunctional DNA-binding transcriptional regulator/antitoxin component of YhaV-PrlF toxin-antitoxin module
MTKQLSSYTRVAMDRVATGLPSKSAKIRNLDSAGYERADIARFLDIRYQHVRNVLVAEKAKKEEDKPRDGANEPLRQVWAQVGTDGRVVIPAPYRQILGIEGGGHIFMVLEDGEVRLIGRDGAIARAQALVAKYVQDESTSVDSFLAERRQEAQREMSGG